MLALKFISKVILECFHSYLISWAFHVNSVVVNWLVDGKMETDGGR